MQPFLQLAHRARTDEGAAEQPRAPERSGQSGEAAMLLPAARVRKLVVYGTGAMSVPTRGRGRRAEYRKRSRAGRFRRGFTLLDVIGGILVLSLLSVCTADIVIQSQAIMAKSHHTDMAADACSSELEAWRTVGYGQIPASSSLVTLQSSSLLCPLPDGLPGATGQLTLRYVSITGTSPSFSCQPASADTGHIQLTMTVSWAGIGADRGSVTLTTVVDH